MLTTSLMPVPEREKMSQTGEKMRNVPRSETPYSCSLRNASFAPPSFPNEAAMRNDASRRVKTPGQRRCPTPPSCGPCLDPDDAMSKDLPPARPYEVQSRAVAGRRSPGQAARGGDARRRDVTEPRRSAGSDARASLGGIRLICTNRQRATPKSKWPLQAKLVGAVPRP